MFTFEQVAELQRKSEETIRELRSRIEQLEFQLRMQTNVHLTKNKNLMEDLSKVPIPGVTKKRGIWHRVVRAFKVGIPATF